MKLIPDWKKAHRFVSVQAMSLAAALQGAWMFMPGDLRAVLNAKLVAIVSLVLLIVGIAGRVIDQPKISAPPVPPEAPK